MNIEGTRRVMETTSHETANQYLRFGWNLINQYVVEATVNTPSAVTYVLASVRRLEDTRQVLTLTDGELVNEHLNLGWKLIDRLVTAADAPDRRHETIHFVLAWQSEDPPARPGSSPPVQRALNTNLPDDDEL
jgi:hypothetical protein